MDVPVLPFPSLAAVVWRMSPSWDGIIECQVGRDLTDHLVQPCLAKAQSRKDALAACLAESEVSNVEEHPDSLGRLFQWLIGLIEVGFPTELCAQRQAPVGSSSLSTWPAVFCCKFRDVQIMFDNCIVVLCVND